MGSRYEVGRIISVFLSSLSTTIPTTLSSSSKFPFTFVNSTETNVYTTLRNLKTKLYYYGLFLGLPFTLQSARGRSFKRSSIRNNLKTPVFREYEINGTFRKRCRHHIIWYFSVRDWSNTIQNDRCRKRQMRFQSETSVLSLFSVVWTGGGDLRLCIYF